MLLLEQDIIKKTQIDKALPDPRKELEFKAGDNKEYEIKAIINSAMYGKQANDSNQMPDFYYLVLWKDYPEEKKT